VQRGQAEKDAISGTSWVGLGITPFPDRQVTLPVASFRQPAHDPGCSRFMHDYANQYAQSHTGPSQEGQTGDGPSNFEQLRLSLIFLVIICQLKQMQDFSFPALNIAMRKASEISRDG
jgi:hypothetical protein